MSFDLDQVRRAFISRQMIYHETLDSTMREAADLAAKGCPKGTTVVAGEQTAGIGRHGHSWHSEAGSGLYVSIVLRPELPPDNLPPLTLAMGLAASEAIGRATDLTCDLRWPNDVMLNDRKVAGILVQLAEPAVIVGIGVNVNHVAFPPELAIEATSLRIASGREQSREQLLIELLNAVDGFTRMLAIAGRRAILDLFGRCSSYARGKRVVVSGISGVTAGSTTRVSCWSRPARGRSKRFWQGACVLLALDAGNTNVTIGVFDDGKLIDNWRLRTVRDQTSDEWGILLRNLFAISKLDTSRVDGIIIASVVPPLDARLAEMTRKYFSTEPMFVTPDTDVGLTIRYDNPRDVGADRVVNGVAAFHKYGGPCVVVDLGTAITFDAISANAEYLGGVIAAGIGISIEALFAKAARLPLVDFREPAQVIGTNTVASMQSGFYYGALGMIDGIVERLIGELGPATRVIATGGHSSLVARGSRYIKQIDENLTLEGLELIWKRNRDRIRR